MTFFGLTALGTNDPISDGTALSQCYVFHTLEREKYLAAFNKYLLEGSETALILEIDGSTNVLRAALGSMLEHLLGRQPRKVELDAWFTYHDFDRSAILGVSEYMASVDRLIEFSSKPSKAATYSSYDVKRCHWLRSVRADSELQMSLKAPMTCSQDIGWHVAMKRTAEAPRACCNHTDVTMKEGHTVQSYFGDL